MADGPKLNFAAAANAAQGKDEVPLRVVEVDGQVVLRIVKHCREASPSLVTGQLLGLDIGSTLEVTSCFPFPVRMLPSCFQCSKMLPHALSARGVSRAKKQ